MFICIEGIAGGGKTTQTKLLADYIRRLKEKDVFVSAAYEGRRREISANFMKESGVSLDQNAVMFLFQALHATQYYEVKEALNVDICVIADRWSPSFFAHHLHQNTPGNNVELLHQLNSLAYRSLEPDMYILIDTPAEIAYKRYTKREALIDDKGLQLMDVEYFISVSHYYQNLAKNNNWNIVPGEGAKMEVFESLQKIIDKML